MPRLTVLAVLAMSLVHGQAFRDLLLPQAQTITGTIVDSNGKPISGVSIEHTANIRQRVVTDEEGKFHLETRAPALVLRKLGYRAHFMRTATVGDVRVILESAHAPGTLEPCSATSICESIKGWGAHFCFPKIAGVKSYPQGQDVDYGSRSYVVSTPNERKGIMHGSGPMWSFGIPLDTDVWKSVEYTETTYAPRKPLDKLLILDARGRTAEGKRWRYLGTFGESASYNDADEDTARLLDRVLDGMCIRH